MAADLLALLPEALLLLGALTCLLGGSFTARTRQYRLRALAGLMSGLSLLTAVLGGGADRAVFEGVFQLDSATTAVRVIVTGALVLLTALGGSDLRDHPRESETCALLLLGGLGSIFLAASTDLALLVVAFLLSSIPLAGLVGIIARPRSAEATLKTYLMGALFGILLMLGALLLYGLAGTTRFPDVHVGLAGAPSAAVGVAGALMLGALMFKAGAVPAHFWVPDAAEGAAVTPAAFLTTVPKIGAVIAVVRLLDLLPAGLPWPTLVGAFAVASMTIGNFAAFAQSDVRRLLGWSTVSQVGYLLAAAAVSATSDAAHATVLFFLGGYALTNLTAFAASAAEPHRRSLEQWAGAGRRRPWLVAALVIALLGFVGTPPMAVFVGKFTTIAATWDAGFAWLAVFLVANSIASLFYYLRWIRPAVRAGDGEFSSAANRGPTAVALAGGAGTVVLGLVAGLIWPLLS